jgi:hypothetical protein
MEGNRNRKYSQQRNELAMKLVRELYRGIDGRELSLQGRRKTDEIDASLTYGEIVPQSFLQILLSITSSTPSHSPSSSSSVSTTSSSSDQVFVDLGCGVGVAVLTAALSSCNFSKVWGIELLQELADAAQTVPEMLSNFMMLSQTHSGSPKKLKKVADASVTSETLHDHLNEVIESIFHGLTVRQMTIENLVDQVCKKVGHKEYKKMLKGSKSFKKFLSLYPSHYQVESEEVSLVLPVEDSFPESHDEAFHEVEQAAETSSEATESRRQTRPEAILSLLKTPTGRNLCQEGSLPVIKFDCDDIFLVNWWDSGDIVYCASLLFSDQMMVRLLELVWRMKPESYFISLKPFPSRIQIQQGDVIHEGEGMEAGEAVDRKRGRELRLVSDSFYRMSWQMARVYIYQLGPRIGEEI